METGFNLLQTYNEEQARETVEESENGQAGVNSKLQAAEHSA